MRAVSGAETAMRIQRIGDGLQMPLRQVEVEDRVLELHVAQQQLNRAQVGAGFQEMCGVRMAQQMRRHALPQPGALGGDDDTRPRRPSA